MQFPPFPTKPESPTTNNGWPWATEVECPCCKTRHNTNGQMAFTPEQAQACAEAMENERSKQPA